MANQQKNKADQKKNKMNVRDLKPKKDAKGGYRIMDAGTRQAQTSTPTRNQ